MCQVRTHAQIAEDELARIARAERDAALERERRERIVKAVEVSLSDEAERRRASRARQVGRRNSRGFKREARGSW